MKTAKLLLIALLFGWSPIFAQIQKGSTYLAPLQLHAGAFGIADDKYTANWQTNSEIDGSNTFYFAILPTYGYTLSNNFLIWTGGTLSNTRTGLDSNTDVDVVLNARFYLNPQSKNDHFFLEAGGRAFQHIGSKLDPYWGYKAKIGLTHFIRPDIALELTAGHEQFESEGNFAFTSGFVVFLNKEASVNNEAIVSPIQKGAVMIGNGLLNINFLADDNRAAVLTPHFSYFLMDKIAAGVSLNYANAHLGENGDVTNWVIEPQVRYYWSKKPSTALFTTIGGGAKITKMKFGNFNIDESDFFYGAGFGLDAFLNSSFAFEFGPNLRHYPEMKQWRVGLDVGVRMFL